MATETKHQVFMHHTDGRQIGPFTFHAHERQDAETWAADQLPNSNYERAEIFTVRVVTTRRLVKTLYSPANPGD